MWIVSRFIQGIGSSISSVLGQAICRDVFHGSRLGEIYSIIAVALALFLSFELFDLRSARRSYYSAITRAGTSRNWVLVLSPPSSRQRSVH